MVFGTYMLDVGDISKLEVQTSEKMQDFLLAFLKDSNTVNTTVGWPAFDPEAPNGGFIIEFGNGTAARNVTANWLDAGCSDTSIPFRIDG